MAPNDECRVISAIATASPPSLISWAAVIMPAVMKAVQYGKEHGATIVVDVNVSTRPVHAVYRTIWN